MLLEVGQTYAGRYRIVRKLGEGAMGAVYEAEHILIHRRVALKVLHPTVAERHGALHRFEREAQAAGRIGSPHIVEVLDMGDLAAAGSAGTARFIVMELLEGETLAERRDARGRLLPEEIAPIACQVLAGLGAAHAADIVHRDLKPANVFLVRGRAGGDFVKILDFGVSKFNTSDDMSATAPGAALGTPYYMSPEQAKGSQRIDARSDLYSVGVMLYECVTGQVPFDAGTFNELIFRIVLESPPPLESFVPDVDPRFVAIVRKAMAREPDERYQTAREFYDALAQWLATVTGQHAVLGVVPWDGGAPYVPSATGTSLPRGPSTEMALEHAQTLLHVPRKRRSLGTYALGLALLGVVAGASLLLLFGGRSGEGASVAAARPSAVPVVSAAPAVSVAPSEPAPVASAPPVAPSVTATATAASPVAVNNRPTSSPATSSPAKKATAAPTVAPAPPPPPPASKGRTVSSEL